MDMFSSASAAAALKGLSHWLLTRAAAVQELDLSMYVAEYEPDAFEVQALLVSVLSTCGALGVLQHARIYYSGRFVLTSWAAGLRQLRTLSLSADKLEVTASMAHLTQLSTLSLTGRSVLVHPQVSRAGDCCCLVVLCRRLSISATRAHIRGLLLILSLTQAQLPPNTTDLRLSGCVLPPRVKRCSHLACLHDCRTSPAPSHDLLLLFKFIPPAAGGSHNAAEPDFEAYEPRTA